MKVEKVYICPHCGKEFDSVYRCIEHEENCDHKNWSELLEKQLREVEEKRDSI